ncbi:hypothetical protein C5S31_06805 [ANME-1 cluster archaeon GoMg2]|nr:hypothetical protein [ANME-1 cluster archaeon GoMg2]
MDKISVVTMVKNETKIGLWFMMNTARCDA